MAVSSWNDNGQKQFVHDPSKLFYTKYQQCCSIVNYHHGAILLFLPFFLVLLILLLPTCNTNEIKIDSPADTT